MKTDSTPIRSATLFLITAALGGVLGWSGNDYYKESVPTASTQSQEAPSGAPSLDEFWQVWAKMEDNYVDANALDPQKQAYGAIEGLVQALGDPYSVFMTPEETEEFNSSLNGELEGIGAELTVENGRLTVVSPLKNSPAEEAGIKSGDIIELVDDKPTSDMTLFEAIMAIRGAEGTQVKLTVVHSGASETTEITITRKDIQVPSVELTELHKNGKTVAHLALYQFGDDTVQEFEEAVHQILLENPAGLILDLRQNGGGYLEASIQVMSEFFKDERTGVIVKYRDEKSEVNKTTGAGQLASIPMVVLIDEGSASASEILAGALKDYKRATLIGVQSFGKGSVQELSDLPDGSTLRLTIAKWFTPNNNTIDHTGITPDVTVKESEGAKFGTDSDNQLTAALDYLLK